MSEEGFQYNSVLVTGASKGIGSAVARYLSESGTAIALMARDQEALNEMADELRALSGNVVAIPCDLSDEQSITAAVERINKEIGEIDVLINNAGAFLEAPVPDISSEQWRYVMDVNLNAAFFLCREFLPKMQHRRRGKIVNIASAAGMQGYYMQAAYCASKHGLLGLSRTLAIEAKPYHVHVHAVCPGGVDTEFAHGTYLSQRLSGQTLLSPEDVARTVRFLVKQPENVDIPEVVMKRFHVE